MASAATTGDQSHGAKNIALKAFLQGFAFFAILYGIGAGWLWQNYPDNREKQESRLASVTAVIERSAETLTSIPAPVPETTEETTTEITASPETTPAVAAEEHAPVTAVEPPATETPPPAPVVEHTAEPVAVPSAPITLAAVPMEGLYETVQEGRLPIIRHTDKLTPFNAYRRPFDRPAIAGDKPVISIAVMEFGLSETVGNTIVHTLPPEVSLALSPYVSAPDFWVNEARGAGHEVWLTLPVESEDYPQSDNGPNALMIGASERQNMTRLTWLLSRAVGYAGVIASHKPIFLKSLNDMRPVVGEIYDRGLGFIDTSDTPVDTIQSIALGKNAPYASMDIWIDEQATPEAIAAALTQLESKAREHGSAIGMIRALPLSQQEVARWIATLPGKGIVLAPLSSQSGG